METMAVIIPTMTPLDLISGPADKDIPRSERHHRIVGAETMAEMMVQDDEGKEGRG